MRQYGQCHYFEMKHQKIPWGGGVLVIPNTFVCSLGQYKNATKKNYMTFSKCAACLYLSALDTCMQTKLCGVVGKEILLKYTWQPPCCY